ncbi:TrlF family AAA-like ATPase [Brevibacillus borstelensis]|uniref:TrlF family AAA-like ATPase n=1 Tax=Brevibacillus borstelensis TaxID=45462 RepID=UPI0032E7FA9E
MHFLCNANAVNKKSNITGWFDNEIIHLNHDLVAVIGNKGNGKSALADIIGLAGGTKNTSEFSFLTKGRFRQGNLAKNFEAVIEWENEVVEKIPLDENPKEHAIEKVKYLPQRYLETLCNVEDDKFENELKKVIFSHVEEKDKHQKSSLNELIRYKSETIKDSIRLYSEQLLHINEQLIELEKKATSNHISAVQELLKNKEQELEAHLKQQPMEIQPPNTTSSQSGELAELSKKIDESKKLLQTLNETIEAKKTEHTDIKNKISLAQRLEEKIKNFEMQYSYFLSNCSDEVDSLGLKIEDIVTLNVDFTSLRKIQADLGNKDNQLMNELDIDNGNSSSVFIQKQKLESIIKESQNKLDEPTQKYHFYKKLLSEWEQKKADTIAEITKLKANISSLQNEIPNDINNLKHLRVEKTKEIFNEITKISKIYSTLYKPVQEFIDNHSLTESDFELKFEVSIDGSAVLEGILEKINQGVRGKFYGSEEGRKLLQSLIEDTNFNSIDSTITFIEKIMSNLSTNPNQPDLLNIETQLKKNSNVLDFYQYLFSLNYLRPFYSLKLGDKEITKLSPGEKGALLLVFYLLVDNDDIPLIIDQPEENLDNQSVFKMLVPCIKEAKKRRQIIMVTHNPNLAVVCDAEQIIHAQIDKTNNNCISYKSGAIENLEMNKCILDILEGTEPAFSNRKSKYLLF